MKSTDIAIVLHKQEYSESSLIIHLLTREQGLQSFIYKGAKRKSSSIFPLCIAEITFYKRKESDLLNLTDFQPVTNWSFQFKPIRSSIAFYCCELIHQCVRQEVGDDELYKFIENTIVQIEEGKIDPLLPLSFAVNLAVHLGFGPLLENKEAKYFDILHASFLSSKPVQNVNYIVEGEAVNLIKRIISKECDIEAPKSIRTEALNIMLKYYRIHIPGFKDLKSLPILETLLNE